MKHSYMGFSKGQLADFNGMIVRLIQTVALPEGQSWRVKSLEGKHAGEVFNIEVSLRHLLSHDIPQERIQWLNTEPSGKAHTHGADCGNTGWRLHAVVAEATNKFSEIRWHPAACGLVPKHGWDLDMFIEEKCPKCMLILEASTPARS